MRVPYLVSSGSSDSARLMSLSWLCRPVKSPMLAGSLRGTTAGCSSRRAVLACAEDCVTVVRSSAGSRLRIARSSCCSRCPGSMPSSSTRVARMRRQTSSASACRPDRYSASISCSCTGSRSGCSWTSALSSPTTSSCRPSSRSSRTRSMTAASRESSSSAAPRRTRSLRTPASAGPCQRPSALRRAATASDLRSASTCARAVSTRPVNCAVSSSAAGISSRYPGERVRMVAVAVASVSTLRSPEMQIWICARAVVGGSVFHTASMSCSTVVTRLALRASIARTTRWRDPPRSNSTPATENSRGPSSRKPNVIPPCSGVPASPGHDVPVGETRAGRPVRGRDETVSHIPRPFPGE